MDDKINTIRSWLGTGSINIFGLPFAGKDTQGELLADMIGGVVLSSGDMLRHNKNNQRLQRLLAAGEIIPSDLFEEIVIPYFSNPDFMGKPLILSEVGRMKGEHLAVIKATNKSNHPQKAVILLKLPDDEVYKRFEAAKQLQDRGSRGDDRREVLQARLDNYKEKVTPVIEYYREQELLIEIDGTLSREDVTESILQSLLDRANEQSDS